MMMKLSFLLLIFIFQGNALALPEEYCAIPGAIFPAPKARELYEISEQAVLILVQDCFFKAIAGSYDSIKEPEWKMLIIFINFLLSFLRNFKSCALLFLH